MSLELRCGGKLPVVYPLPVGGTPQAAEASVRDGLKGRSGRVLRAEKLVLVVMMAMVACDVLRVEMCF